MKAIQSTMATLNINSIVNGTKLTEQKLRFFFSENCKRMDRFFRVNLPQFSSAGKANERQLNHLHRILVSELLFCILNSQIFHA